MAYQIFTDSTADLPPELIDAAGVRIIPIEVEVNGKIYRDYFYGERFSAKDFYDLMEQGAFPQTFPHTQILLEQVFEPVLRQGNDILYLSMSSALSETYQIAKDTAKKLQEQYAKRKIYVIDTKCISMGQGLLVFLSALRQQEGYELEQLVEWTENLRKKIGHVFTVKEMEYLRHGGRVSAFQAKLCQKLHIRPVLQVDEEGALKVVNHVWGHKATLDLLVDIVKSQGILPQYQRVFIAHANCLKDAEYVAKRLQKEQKIEQVSIGCLGAAIGSHTGPNAVCIFFLNHKK